jgi:hypothetical protein
MAVAAVYANLSTSEHSAQLRKAVIASTIGTTIEWYDFFIYGTALDYVRGAAGALADPLRFVLGKRDRLASSRLHGPKGSSADRFRMLDGKR